MTDRLAIDFETYLISEQEGTSPRPVCLSFFDGVESGILTKADIPDFLSAIPKDTEIIAHNIKFEFSVILKHYPELTDWVMSRLESGKVWCTLISEQIINLNKTEGRKKFSLDELVMDYLGIDIKEDKKNPEAWRLRYHELDNVPLELWPKEALDYSLMDSVYAYKVRELQPESHLDSVRASVILGVMADRGFYKREDYVESLLLSLDQALMPLRDTLITAGFGAYDKKGDFKRKTKVIREHINNTFSGAVLTDKGNVATDKATLVGYSSDENVAIWSKYLHLEKMRNTYIKPISDARSVIRTDYNVVVDTCRTSSRSSKLLPSLNMQNIPRGDGVRECFGARPGYLLCAIDYGSLELVCVAQQLFKLYRSSAMMDALNKGDLPVDLHSVLGSKLMSLDEGREVTYEEFLANRKQPHYSMYRTLAKPLNLGYPGGIGPATMSRTAKDSYGVDITVGEARRLKEVFFKAYPELRQLLTKDMDSLKTGNKFLTGALAGSDEYFYSVGGIRRRGCTFNSACNGLLMQTPAALGTKRMLWRVMQNTIHREDVKPLAFIHDEVLFEIRDDENLHSNVEFAAYIMVDSMKEVLPDVRVMVEVDVGPVWRKEGMGWSKQYWR